MKFIDLTGQSFGRLTVLNKIPNKVGRIRWLCLCSCGNKKDVRGENLKNTHVMSCGCLRIEMHTTHGMTKTGTYFSWGSLIQRCTNKNDRRFHDYVGRGITVCDEWRKFENFLRDMGERPRDLSIDRIDNDGNYEPGNCRWATTKQQATNKRPKSKRQSHTQNDCPISN